jgi:hypothetical protein
LLKQLAAAACPAKYNPPFGMHFAFSGKLQTGPLPENREKWESRKFWTLKTWRNISPGINLLDKDF